MLGVAGRESHLCHSHLQCNTLHGDQLHSSTQREQRQKTELLERHSVACIHLENNDAVFFQHRFIFMYITETVLLLYIMLHISKGHK